MRLNGTFNDYAALGITRRGSPDGIVRQISMNGFGAAAKSLIDGRDCWAGGSWESYCDCLFFKGSELMQTCCGKENLKADGSCGPAQWWTGKGFINAPWTGLGQAERLARASGLTDAAKQQFEQAIKGQQPGTGTTPVPDTSTPGGTGARTFVPGGGVDLTNLFRRDGQQSQTNTALLVGGAAVALAAIFLLKK